jgi:peptidoglycan/LPS O-acetylase OafA/YrhL
MPNTRVTEIDLLRFLAALAVVFYHYAFRGYAADAMSVMPYPLLAPVAKYGYLGVELFFMISGFVILMTAASGSLRSFFISRLVRLYPAFWAACTFTFILTILMGAPRYSATVEQYLINMTMLNGFFMVPDIDGAYWTLSIEILFYVLIGIVLLIGRIHQAEKMIALWLIASTAISLYPIRKLRVLLIPDFAPYFIAGAACFLIWSKGPSITRVAIVMVSWGAALSRSIAEMERLEKYFNTPMSRYVVVGIVTAFFVVMMLVALKYTGWVGRARWGGIGALTYPLYLTHHNIGFMVFNKAYPAINMHILFWGMIVAALSLAYAVHVFIEKPFSSKMKAGLNRLADDVFHLASRSIGLLKAHS